MIGSDKTNYQKGKQPMESIDIETILNIIFVLVDDWYQSNGKKSRNGKLGCKSSWLNMGFKEVLTTLPAMKVIKPFPADAHCE